GKRWEIAAAAHRHRRDAIAPRNCLVARRTCLVPDKQGRDGEQQHHENTLTGPANQAQTPCTVCFAGVMASVPLTADWPEQNCRRNLPVARALPDPGSLDRDALLVARPEPPFGVAILQLKLDADSRLPIPDVKAHGGTFDFAVRDGQ